MLQGMRDVRYDHIDFHSVCSANSYVNLNPHIHRYGETIEEFSFYAENLLNRKPRLLQNGVFRINCVDCLDRTNAFMTKLLFIVADTILTHMGVHIPNVTIPFQLRRHI